MLVPSTILYEDRVIVAISFLIKAFNCKFLLSAIRSAGSVKTLFFCYKFFNSSNMESNWTVLSTIVCLNFKIIKCVLYEFIKVFFNQSKFSIVIECIQNLLFTDVMRQCVPCLGTSDWKSVFYVWTREVNIYLSVVETFATTKYYPFIWVQFCAEI